MVVVAVLVVVLRGEEEDKVLLVTIETRDVVVNRSVVVLHEEVVSGACAETGCNLAFWER